MVRQVFGLQELLGFVDVLDEQRVVAAVAVVRYVGRSAVEQVNLLTVADVEPGADQFQVVGHRQGLKTQHVAVEGGTRRNVFNVDRQVVMANDTKRILPKSRARSNQTNR